MGTRSSRGLARGTWERAMAAAARTFPPGNRHGVHGYGITRKREAGRHRNHFTLVVVVERKLRDPRHPIPVVKFRAAGHAYSIEPDVIATGGRPQTHDAGGTTFTGLHAGAVIDVAGDRGGVGALLTTGDGGDEPTHLITCGHLFAPEEVGAKVRAADGAPLATVGTLAKNLLDESATGDTTLDLPFPMDAALVELNATGRALAVATAQRVPCSGIRTDGLRSLRVQAFLPTAHDYSPETDASDDPYSFPAMQSEARGTYPVQLVLRTQSAITQPGDSGTALLTLDDPRLAVGTCIGAVGTAMSLFEPLFRSRKWLAATTGLSLTIWSPRGSSDT